MYLNVVGDVLLSARVISAPVAAPRRHQSRSSPVPGPATVQRGWWRRTDRGRPPTQTSRGTTSSDQARVIPPSSTALMQLACAVCASTLCLKAPNGTQYTNDKCRSLDSAYSLASQVASKPATGNPSLGLDLQFPKRSSPFCVTETSSALASCFSTAHIESPTSHQGEYRIDSRANVSQILIANRGFRTSSACTQLLFTNREKRVVFPESCDYAALTLGAAAPLFFVLASAAP